MSFMSSKEICKCINDGKIKIAYYAVKFDQGEPRKIGEKRFVRLQDDENVTDLDKAIRDYFLGSLKGDSLYLHIGPYVKVEYFTSLRRRRFRAKKSDTISFENINLLSIASGEHVVISTNEYIELSEDIGASIYATVSKTDLGFSHISTVIDPLWRGTLQVGISNISRKSCSLRYLDQFCSVRFHYITGEIDENWEKKRSWKHFANNFFESNSEVKIPISAENFNNINLWRDIFFTHQEWEVLSRRVLQSFNIGLLATGLVLLINLYIQLQKLDNLSENIETNEKSIQETEISLVKLQKDVDSLNSRLIKIEGRIIASGENYLSFSRGSNTEEMKLSTNLKESNPPYVYLLSEDISPSNLTYEMVLSDTQSVTSFQNQEFVLRVKYVGNLEESKAVVGTVKWFVTQ
jgi:deoxycytidine triphosphate deaminase